MTVELPSLAGAAWLSAPSVCRIFAVFGAGGHDVRVVGGAVRNALMGVPVADIDFATTARPPEIMAIAEASGIKAVPTGIDHGTVTLVADGHAYEVTTLREDIVTDGRHAIVRFGHDWTADAMRRDFTVNTLSADAAGIVHDPVRGYADIVACRIRFIGEAERRIAEDRLRILRFFRFSAEYAAGDVDAAGLAAAIRARAGLRDLSAERIGNEMRRLVVARRAAEVATVMEQSGILSIVHGGVAYLAAFARLHGLGARGMAATAPVYLAALACKVEEDVERIASRLRLANAERDRMLAALRARSLLSPLPDMQGARRALYAAGAAAYRDGLALAFAEGVPEADRGRMDGLESLPDRWNPPKFPLGGRDVVGGLTPPGPAVGALLRAVEAWWIDEDFRPDEDALRSRLQQMIAAGQ